MQTFPCGHQVVCRRCFVKTIQMAVSQRLLPLRCVMCRAKILKLKQHHRGPPKTRQHCRPPRSRLYLDGSPDILNQLASQRVLLSIPEELEDSEPLKAEMIAKDAKWMPKFHLPFRPPSILKTIKNRWRK